MVNVHVGNPCLGRLEDNDIVRGALSQAYNGWLSRALPVVRKVDSAGDSRKGLSTYDSSISLPRLEAVTAGPV